MRSVRVVSNGGLSQGSKLVDTETGDELHGVRKIVATIEVDNFNIIEAEFVSGEIEVEGQFEPYFMDPTDGAMRQVKRIEWADGGHWDAENSRGIT